MFHFKLLDNCLLIEIIQIIITSYILFMIFFIRSSYYHLSHKRWQRRLTSVVGGLVLHSLSPSLSEGSSIELFNLRNYMSFLERLKWSFFFSLLDVIVVAMGGVLAVVIYLCIDFIGTLFEKLVDNLVFHDYLINLIIRLSAQNIRRYPRRNRRRPLRLQYTWMTIKDLIIMETCTW